MFLLVTWSSWERIIPCIAVTSVARPVQELVYMSAMHHHLMFVEHVGLVAAAFPLMHCDGSLLLLLKLSKAFVEEEV